MLKAVDVRFGYRAGSPVVNGVSLEIPYRGFGGILGPNGSGKTTLLKILSGTLKPSSGYVTVEGADVHRMPRRDLARRLAVVPQETQLAFDYSVLEVVLMGRYPHLGAFEIEGPGDIEIARDALRVTGTLTLQDRAFATLSGGEKQRVIIASALAQIRGQSSPAQHPLLLLDEPTTALDLGYWLEAVELLRDLQRQLPLTVLISTHDLNFAAALCQTLVLIRDGRVRAAGLTADVLNPPNIRDLYGVDADVHHHAGSGQVVVIPVSRRREDVR